VIKLIIGLLLVFGAVGESDYNENANLLLQSGIAILGLALMASGVKTLERNS
jgi:hypothetical protein